MTVFSIHFTLVAKIFHSLHVYTEFVCILKTLENPRISGVLFQGLEITWNWFFVLESACFFIEQDWKILMFISFKWNESQWKQMFTTGKQSIKFMKCLLMCNLYPGPSCYFRACPLSHSSIVHSECLVCMRFQALNVWLVCMLQVNLWKEKSLKILELLPRVRCVPTL